MQNHNKTAHLSMKTVVRFTDIHHGQILAIYKHMGRLILLSVHVVAAGCENLLSDGIFDAQSSFCAVVVAVRA